MIPGGWLIDRRGPKFALAIVVFGSAAFVALTATVGFASNAATAIALLLVIRSLMGMLSSPLHPAAATAVSLDIPPARRSAANGLITGAALLGIACTYVVFGKLIDWFDWPGAFLITSMVTLGLGVLWMMYGPRREDAAYGSPSVARELTSDLNSERTLSFAWLSRHKNLILLTASYGAVGYFQYLFFYWMHHYFQRSAQAGRRLQSLLCEHPALGHGAGNAAGRMPLRPNPQELWLASGSASAGRYGHVRPVPCCSGWAFERPSRCGSSPGYRLPWACWAWQKGRFGSRPSKSVVRAAVFPRRSSTPAAMPAASSHR